MHPLDRADARVGRAEYSVADIGPDVAREQWVWQTVEAAEEKRKLDRLARTKTLFRVEGDEPTEWRTLNRPYDPTVQAWLDRMYGAKVVAVYGRA